MIRVTRFMNVIVDAVNLLQVKIVVSVQTSPCVHNSAYSIQTARTPSAAPSASAAVETCVAFATQETVQGERL